MVVLYSLRGFEGHSLCILFQVLQGYHKIACESSALFVNIINGLRCEVTFV